MRACVIGGGAAGLAAAWSLGRRPRTQVALWEASARLGGVATTERSPGGGWFNDGVQAAAPSYRNVFCLLETLGLEATPVDMKVSFGRGETTWCNQHDSPRARSLRAEIARFGRVLEVAHRLRPLFAVLPIDRVLSTLGFSDAFRYEMVYPLTALFFGTGNQTPSVSTAVIAAVFLDPEVRLFDYDPERLLSQTPTMYALPALGELYRRWGERIDGDIHLSRPVARVRRRARGVEVEDEQGRAECFDEVVFACDAATVLRLLDAPTWRERRVLGNVRYFRDVTVTHTDTGYMNAHYEVDRDRGDQYFVRNCDGAPQLIEMSFDLSAYQPQLDDAPLFQTIFLDASTRATWSRSEIDPDTVVLEKWWTQFSHTWRHFAGTVPWMRWLQGRRHTWFAGAYTLFNTHELALCSGFAVAHRLGAPYPFAHDAEACARLDGFMRVVHGRSRRLEEGIGAVLRHDFVGD